MKFIWPLVPKNKLLLFLILLMVMNCSSAGDKLLFIMNICIFIHSIIGGSAGWYADVCLPMSGWAS